MWCRVSWWAIKNSFWHLAWVGKLLVAGVESGSAVVMELEKGLGVKNALKSSHGGRGYKKSTK
jgi:hypothetical protein